MAIADNAPHNVPEVQETKKAKNTRERTDALHRDAGHGTPSGQHILQSMINSNTSNAEPQTQPLELHDSTGQVVARGGSDRGGQPGSAPAEQRASRESPPPLNDLQIQNPISRDINPNAYNHNKTGTPDSGGPAEPPLGIQPGRPTEVADASTEAASPKSAEPAKPETTDNTTWKRTDVAPDYGKVPLDANEQKKLEELKGDLDPQHPNPAAAKDLLDKMPPEQRNKILTRFQQDDDERFMKATNSYDSNDPTAQLKRVAQTHYQIHTDGTNVTSIDVVGGAVDGGTGQQSTIWQKSGDTNMTPAASSDRPPAAEPPRPVDTSGLPEGFAKSVKADDDKDIGNIQAVEKDPNASPRDKARAHYDRAYHIDTADGSWQSTHNHEHNEGFAKTSLEEKGKAFDTMDKAKELSQYKDANGRWKEIKGDDGKPIPPGTPEFKAAIMDSYFGH